jgi:AraC-like DNA-binding protein
LIRQADPGVFKLGCVVEGGGIVDRDGRCAVLGVGDMVFYDPSQPYRGEFRPDVPVSKMLLLRFPRSLLALPPKQLRELNGVRIPGDRVVGALSAQFLLHLARRMGELSPADTARLSTLTLDVLTTALADALDARTLLPPHARRRALMARIHAFIAAHLGDHDLTPDAIAAAHHISLRYLHKLFQQDGETVAGWVRARRLEHCSRDLADPLLAGRPIHAVANRWGFRSAAHFSQAFRHAYGLSPREFREQHAYPEDPAAEA